MGFHISCRLTPLRHKYCPHHLVLNYLSHYHHILIKLVIIILFLIKLVIIILFLIKLVIIILFLIKLVIIITFLPKVGYGGVHHSLNL